MCSNCCAACDNRPCWAKAVSSLLFVAGIVFIVLWFFKRDDMGNKRDLWKWLSIGFGAAGALMCLITCVIWNCVGVSDDDDGYHAEEDPDFSD